MNDEVKRAEKLIKLQAAKIREQLFNVSDLDLVTVSTEVYNKGLCTLAEYIQDEAKKVHNRELPF